MKSGVSGTSSQCLQERVGSKFWKKIVRPFSFIKYVLLIIERKRQFSKLKNLARQRGINHEDSRVSYNTHKGNI